MKVRFCISPAGLQHKQYKMNYLFAKSRSEIGRLNKPLSFQERHGGQFIICVKSFSSWSCRIVRDQTFISSQFNESILSSLANFSLVILSFFITNTENDVYLSGMQYFTKCLGVKGHRPDYNSFIFSIPMNIAIKLYGHPSYRQRGYTTFFVVIDAQS